MIPETQIKRESPRRRLNTRIFLKKMAEDIQQKPFQVRVKACVEVTLNRLKTTPETMREKWWEVEAEAMKVNRG